jgi:hypothetical protein
MPNAVGLQKKGAVLSSGALRVLLKRSIRFTAPALLAVALAGCGAKLPDCKTGLEQSNTQATPVPKKLPKSSQSVLIGIDGSGSMLGFAQADNKTVWASFLQSINQGILLEGLMPITYRIGAGVAEGPFNLSITKATNPCFFKGCDGYRDVASSLGTLWSVNASKEELPLRLLVSDLEVNQNDISSLLKSTQSDLARGANAGVLALKVPFTGDVYDADGQVISKGNTIRPIYILATGPREQVKSVLDEINKTLALRGLTETRLSLLEADARSNTLEAKWIGGLPPKAAKRSQNLKIEGNTYSRTQNPNYQFIRLNSGANGLAVATTRNWSGGSERPNLGIAELQKISAIDGQLQPLDGIGIKNIELSGVNIRLDLAIDKSTPSGIYRIVVPAGSMPAQWWLDWDRTKDQESKEVIRTQGLLNLMISLGRQIAGYSNGPPAASICIALENQS